MKAISLFSGMGGDTLGMEQAGVEVVAFNEVEPSCVKVHLDNFPESTFLRVPDIPISTPAEIKKAGNIQSVPDSVFEPYAGEVDIVFAGFPCQGFSHAGKKQDNDPRNRLFYEFLRVANIVKPRFIIGENVPGLLRRKTDGGECQVIEKIADEFAEIGYKLTWKVLDASNYGVPQSRKRLFIVGFRNPDEYTRWSWDSVESHKVSTTPTIRSILDTHCLRGAMPLGSDVAGGLNTVTHSEDVLRLLSDDWEENSEEYEKETHPYVRVKVGDGELSFGKRASPTHSEILSPDKPCKTLISTYSRMPRLLVSVGGDEVDSPRWIRRMTPREGKQVQGFPEDFKLDAAANITATWVMIGNAVPPPVIRIITTELKRIIE